MIVIPGTMFPCWSWTTAVMENIPSAVIVSSTSSTIRVTGSPGVTVMSSDEQITPKHAVIV